MSTTSEIVRFAVYPSLGVARVGNSPDGYFFGPELPGRRPRSPNGYRDAAGRIERQAARFRVYGFDAAGNVVQEITAADADIRWTVRVANEKAAWYDFDQALDIPASEGEIPGVPAVVSKRRNAAVLDRATLAISPSPVSVSGVNVNADGQDAACAFADGTFVGTPVYLGELRTDAEGRLVFLGGRGHAASATGEKAITFANNDGWHDDTCDGPVDAEITWKGRTFRADGAWVLVAPPDYAPGIQGLVTGYDLLLDVAVRQDPTRGPTRPSFAEHIWPFLRRLADNQWVNAGFARDFGFGSPSDLARPDLIARLADPGEAASTLRATVFRWFRDAAYPYLQPNALPPFYGDAVTLSTKTTDPREWMAVPPTQYGWLAQWAAGDFTPDLPEPTPPWSELGPAEQVRLIDRGVLDEVLGGPFHPGCEFTWPMRHASMYAAPFRIARRAAPEPDYGPTLDSTIALGAGGPLDGVRPGGLTRWMAVPWHTDTSSCLSAYMPYVDDYLPTFWPARVPNDVLTEAQHAVLTDPVRSLAEKQEAFGFPARAKWLRGVVYEQAVSFPPKTYPYQDSINQFVQDWWQLGIVLPAPGPGAPFPDEVRVETGRSLPEDRPTAATALPLSHPDRSQY